MENLFSGRSFLDFTFEDETPLFSPLKEGLRDLPTYSLQFKNLSPEILRSKKRDQPPKPVNPRIDAPSIRVPIEIPEDSRPSSLEVDLNLTSETPEVFQSVQVKVLRLTISPTMGDLLKDVVAWFPNIVTLTVTFQITESDRGKAYPIPIGVLTHLSGLKDLTLENIVHNAVRFTYNDQTSAVPIEKPTDCLQLSSLKVVHFDQTFRYEQFFFGAYRLKKLHLERGDSHGQEFFLGHRYLYQIRDLTLIDYDLRGCILFPTFFHLQTLRHLRINRCNLMFGSIVRIGDLKLLESLDISQNRVVKLPANIFTDLVNLKVLNVAENSLQRLAVIQEKINLHRLEKLICRDNQIDLIGKGIFRLPNLTVLDAEKNPLTPVMARKIAKFLQK